MSGKPKSVKIAVTVNPVRQRALYHDVNDTEEGHRGARILELAAYGLAMINGQAVNLPIHPKFESTPIRQSPSMQSSEHRQSLAEEHSQSAQQATRSRTAEQEITGVTSPTTQSAARPLLSPGNSGPIYGTAKPHKAIPLSIDPNDL